MNEVKSPLVKRLLMLVLLISLCLSLSPAQGFKDIGEYEENRSRLLSFMIKRHLSSQHFSHKEIDNSLSEDAFGLFLKDLDFQKRFLLKEDVEKLNAYSERIDDELNSGKMELPDLGAEILSRRAEEAEKIVHVILSEDFDFSVHESLETDPEKLDFCKTSGELKERWRKMLKYQTIHEYLNMLDENPSGEPTTDATDNTVKKEKTQPEDIQEKARAKLLKDYEALFSRMRQETEREHFDRYFSAVARAFDPHTDYMPPTNKEDFDIHMRGSLEGIGATLTEKDGFIKVVDIIPGGPAYLQGELHAEDIILKVAEGKSTPVDISNMRVRDAVKLIRGKKGTEVRLTVRKPDGTRSIIPIIRDVVQLKGAYAKGTTLKDEKSGQLFGYIKIPTFYRDFESHMNGGTGRNSSDDVRKELEKFKSEKIGGLIVDLRNNGGGALADAVNIAGLFIKSGPVVQVKDSRGKISVLSDTDPGIVYDGPVIVLVNKISASASEIFAGALQDYGRAIIMGGEHTHGKGTVQAIISLDDSIPLQNMEKYKTLGALKITIQKFYRISGETTQYKGVVPDILLPDRWKVLKSGEQHLDFALPWDTIKPSSYTKWERPLDGFDAIRSKSSERIKSNTFFVDLGKDIAKAMTLQQLTKKSLRLDDVRKERENLKKGEDDARDFHGGTRPDTGMSEEDERLAWIKKVKEDAYVQEAVAVLSDVLSASHTVSMK